jgi:hypothetical protein
MKEEHFCSGILALVTYAGVMAGSGVAKVGLGEDEVGSCVIGDEQAVISWYSCSGGNFKYRGCFVAGSSSALGDSIMAAMLLIDSVTKRSHCFGGVSKVSER